MSIFQIVVMNVAVSDSVAEDVKRKLAFEKDGDSCADETDDVGDAAPSLMESRLSLEVVFLWEGRGSSLSGSVGMVFSPSKMPATFKISLPTSFCSASTVDR